MMRLTGQALILMSGLMLMMSSALALDDPTRPPGHRLPGSTGGTASGPVWHVSTIKIASKHKTAVINGRTVTVGHRVNGATVIDIGPAKVKFRKEGKEFSVRLFANSVKKINRVSVK